MGSLESTTADLPPSAMRLRSSTDASGIGEPATVPTAAAIANAVYNALGVRLRDLPLTPARVLSALAKQRGEHLP